MRPYALIDLHCDTLTDCMYAGSNIIDTLDDPAPTRAPYRQHCGRASAP